MALFNEQIIQEIATMLARRYQQMGEMLGMPAGQIDPANAPITDTLHLLIQIANGEIIRGEAAREVVMQVDRTLAMLHDLLFGTVLGPTAPIPSGFWSRDIGILYSRVRWWLSGDDLITISNAAALAFGENNQANRMRVVRAIDGGILDAIPDPSVANPQQSRRVLRPQVEHWAELRRRPASEVIGWRKDMRTRCKQECQI